MKQAPRIMSFFAFPAAVLLAHVILARVFHVYLIFPRLDIPVHYIGGLSIAFAAAQILSYLQEENRTAALDRATFLLLVFALTATATVIWEFVEFFADRLLDTNLQVSLANTMQDQFMGILGGITWVCFWKGKKDRII